MTTNRDRRMQLLRQLSRLEMEQARDRRLLADYQSKRIPDKTSFVKQMQRAVQYRQERISNLKYRLQGER